MGVDIADIRCIVHVDRPRTLLDYAQESGRAGRDGLASEAVIIEVVGEGKGEVEGQTEEERRLVGWYMEGEDGVQRCRRAVLDGYLDGREDRNGCEDGEALCDVCGGVYGAIEEAAQEEQEMGDGASAEVEQEEEQQRFWQQERERQGPREDFMRKRQQEFGEVEWLRRQLQGWTGRCGICEAAGAGQSRHDLRRCWREESRGAKEMVKMKKIKFENFSGCFWCGVPQAICRRWEDNGQGRYQRAKGGCCQYTGTLVAGVVGLVFGYKGQVWERWRRQRWQQSSQPAFWL